MNHRRTQRIEDINYLLMELASGNFDAAGDISEKIDEYDGIITGINMLGEELKASTVSRDYLKSIFEGVVDVLLVVDMNNNIQEVNKSACEILGYTQGELLGNPLYMLLSNKRDRLLPVKKLLDKNGYCHNIEKIFVTKTGLNLPVSCSISFLYDKNGNKNGILYIAKDITKIKRTEEDLRNKNSEMDTFIYKAAHDLKGPVASILGITNVVSLDVKDKMALKYFSMIHECSEKLDKVLVNLREIAAVNKAKKEKTKINIREELETVLTAHKEKMAMFNIKVMVDVKVDADFYTNEKMFRAILSNLIDNSIKFRNTEIDTKVLIKIRDTFNGINVTVKDNGLGIKKKIQHKVFDMFFRGQNSKDGSGLGLYMVKTFVQAMDGYVTMKTSENKGATFGVFLTCM